MRQINNTHQPALFGLLLALMLGTTLQAQTAFSEDFEDITITNQVGAFPSGWTVYGDNHTNVGNLAMFGNSWVVSQVENTNKAAASVSYVNESGDCDRWLITPAITIPDASYSLQLRAFAAFTSDDEKLRIMVSTTDDQKTSFTTTLRDIIFNGNNGASAGWNNITLPLTDFAGQAIRIAFVNHGHNQFVFVDDIAITATSENLHMPLLESFTSQYCGNCPEGHEELADAYQGLENRIAWVSHHAGYQDDAYTISASSALEALYNTNSYAPALAIDRDMTYAGTSPGPIHYVGTSVMMHLDLSRAASEADNIVIGLTDINYNPANRNLQLAVDGYFINDQDIDNPRLTIYLVEDSIIAFQYGDNLMNNYRHDHTIRACLTDSWGDADIITATTAGSHFHKSLSYTLPVDCRPDKCYIVAFVNEYGTSTVTGRRVLNSTKSGYITSDHGSELAIDPAEASILVKTYPNPASHHAYLSAESTIHSFILTDIAGRTLKQRSNINANTIELDIADLPTGLYLVGITTDNGVATARLNVAR